MAQVLSRKVQTIKIYNRVAARNTNPDLLREKVLKEVQAKIGMSAGGASTYFANIRNGTWSVVLTPVKAVKAVKPVKSVVKPVKVKTALTVVK